jgi:hypothetical protein
MDEKVRRQARKAARDAFDAVERWDAAIDAYEAALEAAGYVFVPREATRDMTLAWAIKSPAFPGTGAAHQHAREVWSIMIDAATTDS